MSDNKKISELGAASTLSGSDMLVVSQSGNSEATRTTVSALAAAIGELNEAGALAELALSTSIGKNLLAQNLNEKGITASPTESLVSLADKVGSLSDEGPIRTKYLYHTLDTVTGVDTNSGHWSTPTDYFELIGDEYIAYISSTYLYIAEKTGLKSIDDLKSKAVVSCLLSENVQGGTYFAFSPDYTKFVIGANGSTSSGSQRPVMYHIYDITWTNGVPTAITYLKSRQTSETSSSQYFYWPAITNDAKFVAFRYSIPSSNSNYIRIESTYDSTVYATISGTYSYKGAFKQIFKDYDGDSATLAQLYLYTFTYDSGTSEPTSITATEVGSKQINLFGTCSTYLVDINNSIIYQTEYVRQMTNKIGNMGFLDGSYGFVSIIDFSNFADIVYIKNFDNKFGNIFVYQNTSTIMNDSASSATGVTFNTYNTAWYKDYMSLTLPEKDNSEFSIVLYPTNLTYTYNKNAKTLTCSQTIGDYKKLFTYDSQYTISYGTGPTTFTMVVLGYDDNGDAWGKSGSLFADGNTYTNVHWNTTAEKYLYAIQMTNQTNVDFLIYPLVVSSLGNLAERTYTPVPTTSL